jgi:hypothetical protein
MTKTMAILLGLAAVWATAWGIAGSAMHGAGKEKLAQSDHVSTLATTLDRGAPVRFEGTIAEAPKVKAPFSEKECLAAYTYVALRGSYQDSQGKTVPTSSAIKATRVGPVTIGIMLGDKRVELPLDRWMPEEETTSAGLKEIPPRLGVTEAEIEDARSRLRGNAGLYYVSETTLDAGQTFFVVGKIEDHDGPPRLEPDPMFERVVLFQGSHQQFIDKLRGSGGGLKIAGWIVGLGVGPLPLVIVGLVLLSRSRARETE